MKNAIFLQDLIQNGFQTKFRTKNANPDSFHVLSETACDKMQDRQIKNAN